MTDRRESNRERGIVWYPADFSRGGLVAALPEDLEPRMLEPGQPVTFSSDEAGVLLLDGPVDDLDGALLDAARQAMVPAVVLSDSAEGGSPAQGIVSLTLPVGTATLASVLRAACEQARVTREARESTRQLEELNAIGVRLSGERDTKHLLELILTTARNITRSDAGSIYLVETASDGTPRLRFELAQNDSVPVEFNAVELPLTEDSLAGHVALTGEILDVADAYALPDDRPYRFNPEVDALAGYRTKSLLVLPMQTPGGEIIGVLALLNCKREAGRPFPSTAAIEQDALPYPPAFRNLAASLASQAAVALSNSNLFRELTRRQGRLEALVDISQRVTRLWPPATVQRRIADLYTSLLQADAVAFHLVDEGRLVRAEVRGDGMAALLPEQIALGEGPIGRVAASGEPLPIMDLAGYAGLDAGARDHARRVGMRAALAVPVRAGDRLVGVLSALTSQAGFSEDDVALASTFAAQAGIAVENSRLYFELEKALEGVRKSQGQLVQVERLRALGEMAAGVAHDFNNLLAVVMLRTELLLNRGQAPDVAESLTMIRQAAHDGAQTVRRIQEFTRTRSTRPFGRVDMQQVLQEVVELARPRWRDQAQSRGVTYDVRVKAGKMPLVAGTAEEVREALLNLLNNGLDAMPGGGTFTFRAEAEDGHVVIQAGDSGCGMSEETRRRVFEPFFSTKGAQGNGLGLAVVWGIVARHSGEITVDSVLNQGTTFTIRLPVPAVLPEDPAGEQGSRIPKGKRVLVVEDNLEILRSLADLLREHGCRVVEAPNGTIALARIEAEPVDLVLTDLAMPGVSGWEVAATCRERWPDTPVGLITGFGDRLEPGKIEQHGIRFVVAKPFTSEELLRTVGGALAGVGAGEASRAGQAGRAGLATRRRS